MSNFSGNTLSEYLENLAAKQPAPGGGSAAALTAALAAALVSMAARYTIGKPAYARIEAGMKKILDASEKLRMEFLRLVDLDCAAYESGRLRDALNIPLMVARLCYEGIRDCPSLAKKGNRNLVTDAGIAACLFEAAYTASCMNVGINLAAIGDKKLSRAMLKELEVKNRRVKKCRLLTEEIVGAAIRGETLCSKDSGDA